MDWIDLLQWPAMVVTVVAAWFVASKAKVRRRIGFWAFLASNVLWVAWAWSSGTWALLVLQVALATINVRGALENRRSAREPSASRDG